MRKDATVAEDEGMSSEQAATGTAGMMASR